MDAALEQKMRDLLDREAILQVLHRMARGLDRVDNDLVLSCYWPEAIDDHTHYVGGPEGFAQYAEKMTRAFVACQHGLMTHNCELAGEEAHCETYYTFTAHAAQPPHFMATGRYVDHFQKRDGEWRILYRRCTVEMSMDGSAAWVNGPMCKGFLRSVWSKEDKSYQRPIEVGTDGERW